MIPMFKQKVGMTKIYAKGIAELFLIRCNPYHWDGSGEVPDNISFDVYKRKIDETYDGMHMDVRCIPRHNGPSWCEAAIYREDEDIVTSEPSNSFYNHWVCQTANATYHLYMGIDDE